MAGPEPFTMVAIFTPPANAVYAGWLTVKVLPAVLFENVPLGMNWALTECLPKKYALPPGCGVRVAVALAKRKSGVRRGVGDSVSVSITWPWSMMLTVPCRRARRGGGSHRHGERDRLAERPGATARVVSVAAALLRVCSATSAALGGGRRRSRKQEQPLTGPCGLRGFPERRKRPAT